MPRTPAFTDLVGIGKTVGELRKLLEFWIKYRSARRNRGLKDDEQFLKNQQLMLKNDAQAIENRTAELQLAEKFIETMERHQINPSDLIQLVAAFTPLQEPLKTESEKLPRSAAYLEIRSIPKLGETLSKSQGSQQTP